ncbi:putative prolyl 4-hydroxylase 4 [Madurella mycetomatis]|uniref:Prolyl 4-hydroxylase 4 n=1 Tax=Madurella mycetomatis TaxID=100816 RepID=A0A175W968_9PEZI|nr:putative prolyl 4-hydroxylase 4 [Madurella mycetomatis]
MPSIQSLISTFAIVAALRYAPAHAGDAQQPLGLASDSDYVCEHPPYNIRMVSHSPLVIYIRNFITAEERGHLQRLAKDTFIRSGVTSNKNSQNNHNSARRTSQSTTLPPTDPVVSCIESRALLFQGYDTPRSHLEPLQLVKYGPTEHYHFHTDWFTSPAHSSPSQGGNRVSSFFAYIYVANDTTGGGTNFPRLEVPTDEKWCEKGIIDCDEPWERGVTFRPVEGNAVYWVNLLPGHDRGGRRMGDERTLHAGLPVTGGGKIGMNIWTREGPVGERGDL